MTLSRRTTLIILLISMTSLLLFSSPCRAKTTLTVQIAYRGVICGGVGLILYFSHSVESALRSPDIMPALLNIRSGKIALGIPAIKYVQSVPEISPNPSAGSYCIRLFRWEF